MGLEKKIIYVILKFLSFFANKQKIRTSRVTFISLTESTLSKDFKALNDELLSDENIEIKYNLLFFEKNLKGKFLYFLNCIRQLFLINSSAVVIINDNNYVISNFKRQEVAVIQVWHACGAIKKFGNQISREYHIKNYDYVLSTGTKWSKVFSEAFGVKEANVIPIGIPRTDVLFNKEQMEKKKEMMLHKYPQLANKYVVLYAPTFRGNIIKGFTYENVDLDFIANKLPSDTYILCKMHPQLKKVILGKSERVLNVNEEELYDLFSITDCLISDYSSIIFDFSILERKIIYYIPDIDEYDKNRGLNIDFHGDLYGDICLNTLELIKSISEKNYSLDYVKKLKNMYFDMIDGRSTMRVIDLITNILSGDISKR